MYKPNEPTVSSEFYLREHFKEVKNNRITLTLTRKLSKST